MNEKITKSAFSNALKTLLKKKSLNQIRISDITTAAGKNRMTFYYHFKDIYDLVSWMIQEDIHAEENKITNTSEWKRDLTAVMSALKLNESAISNIIHSVGMVQSTTYLLRLFRTIVEKFFEQELPDMYVSYADRTRIVNFHSYGLTGIILEWCETGMKEQPAVLIDQYTRAVKAMIRSAKSVSSPIKS